MFMIVKKLFDFNFFYIYIWLYQIQDGIKDNWMDDIDWVKVKQKAGKDGDNKEKDDGSESSDSEPEQIDELQSWRGLPI